MINIPIFWIFQKRGNTVQLMESVVSAVASITNVKITLKETEVTTNHRNVPPMTGLNVQVLGLCTNCQIDLLAIYTQLRCGLDTIDPGELSLERVGSTCPTGRHTIPLSLSKIALISKTSMHVEHDFLELLLPVYGEWLEHDGGGLFVLCLWQNENENRIRLSSVFNCRSTTISGHRLLTNTAY